MSTQAEYDKLANKLIHIEDKITKLDKIAKTLNIWIKENDYELILIAKMLDIKLKEVIKIIEN